MEDKQDNKTHAASPKLLTGFLAGLLYFFFVIGVSALLAVFGWQSAKDVLGLMKEEKIATIVVKENYKLSEISKQLEEAGIIENSWLFTMFARFSKADEKIKPGEYEVNAILDYRAIVNSLRGKAAKLEEIRVTIPEGKTLEEIIELFDEKGVSDADKLWDTAQNHAFDYDFLADLPMDKNRLEGYLFPDTYDFYIDENPISVFNKLLANFNRKFTDEFEERTEELEMTIAEIITVASLVEREAANDDERGLMASVIYNRLNSKDMKKLQIDATLQYIMPVRKAIPTDQDKAIDSPYNTYMYEGLPPGPIASPGLESIRAALYPEESSYYYYALTSDHTHKFSKTKAEHDKVVADNREFYKTLE